MTLLFRDKIEVVPARASNQTSSVMGSDFDVVIMTDLRFPGGSSSSTLEEVRIQHEMGIRTGLLHRPSSVLRRKRSFNPKIIQSILDGECELVNFEPAVHTKVLLVRHPSVIHPPVDPLPQIVPDQVILIVNHPPVNAFGRVDYILPFVIKILRDEYRLQPLVYPIGPLVREEVEKYYDGSVSLEQQDWSNLFDANFFQCPGRIPRRPLRVGRHSRPGREKWPDSPDVIRAAYVVDSEHPVLILGGADVPVSILGYKPKNWTIYSFNAVDVLEFLRSIDVFVYFHHPQWTEAFGRVIAEAMASGLPTILPHHFEPIFKEGAIYAVPEDVPHRIRELSEPQAYAAASQRARSFVVHNFERKLHVQRLLRVHPRLFG